MSGAHLQYYEAWLDTLDALLVVEDTCLVSRFAGGLRIPFSECSDADALVLWARRLEQSLRQHSAPVNIEYVLHRFTGLVAERNRLDIDPGEIVWSVLVGYRRS